MDYLGHKVSRLIRISYGPFQLGNLEDGDIKAVNARFLQISLALAITRRTIVKPTLFIKKPDHNSADKRGRHANHQAEAVAELF